MMEYYSEIIILSEINKYHMISLICGIQNMAEMNLTTKQSRFTDVENRLVVTKGRGRERHGLGVWGW